MKHLRLQSSNYKYLEQGFKDMVGYFGLCRAHGKRFTLAGAGNAPLHGAKEFTAHHPSKSPAHQRFFKIPANQGQPQIRWRTERQQHQRVHHLAEPFCPLREPDRQTHSRHKPQTLREKYRRKNHPDQR